MPLTQEPTAFGTWEVAKVPTRSRNTVSKIDVEAMLDVCGLRC